jgi:hypothetical protein
MEDIFKHIGAHRQSIVKSINAGFGTQEEIEKAIPVGTVNKYGKTKMPDGSWQYVKKHGEHFKEATPEEKKEWEKKEPEVKIVGETDNLKGELNLPAGLASVPITLDMKAYLDKKYDKAPVKQTFIDKHGQSIKVYGREGEYLAVKQGSASNFTLISTINEDKEGPVEKPTPRPEPVERPTPKPAPTPEEKPAPTASKPFWPEPEQKDLDRINGLIKRQVNGHVGMVRLAQDMAQAITDVQKAGRRYSAAKQILGVDNPATKVFEDRAMVLAGLKDNPVFKPEEEPTEQPTAPQEKGGFVRDFKIASTRGVNDPLSFGQKFQGKTLIMHIDKDEYDIRYGTRKMHGSSPRSYVAIVTNIDPVKGTANVTTFDPRGDYKTLDMAMSPDMSYNSKQPLSLADAFKYYQRSKKQGFNIMEGEKGAHILSQKEKQQMTLHQTNILIAHQRAKEILGGGEKVDLERSKSTLAKEVLINSDRHYGSQTDYTYTVGDKRYFFSERDNKLEEAITGFMGNDLTGESDRRQWTNYSSTMGQSSRSGKAIKLTESQKKMLLEAHKNAHENERARRQIANKRLQEIGQAVMPGGTLDNIAKTLK